MPIYEYKCNKCNNKFEFFHKSLRNEEIINCPKCSSREIKKLFSKFSSTKNENFNYSSNQSYCDTPSSCGCTGGMCNLN
jgi:putative FmdB family regulatory protein